MSAPLPVDLRRALLAVSVLHDLDVEPTGTGALLPGSPPVHVDEAECRAALAGAEPESVRGRRLLAAWLLARRQAADVGPARLREALRPVGLPTGHLLHPGPAWVQARVLGGALDLGLGAVGLDPADPDRVVLLPPTALLNAGVDPAAAWRCAEQELERLGGLAAERARLDRRGQLRPMADCDVVTLLGSASLRSGLAAEAGGMAAVVVPMRRRGWTRLALVDPAFGPAAAAATPPEERGFPRPLLVTADELAVAPEGGRPQEVVLRQPAAEPLWERSVLYR